ncbi:MAG: hypothetical protein F2599_05095 [Actinobacteria bacterium]|uniref:Unannotated protein n=1 Tax=freshwater metagenome TaxID=449393 RepID=A0A6J6IRZ4_9ZZZZ|nr:hypothetical protein [Actinomycetota bacterium]
MGKSGCLTIFVFAFVIYGFSTANENPTILIATLLAAAGGGIWAYLIKSQDKKKDLIRLERISNQLLELSQELGNLEIPGFTAEKGETPIYKLSRAALTEFRSTGSSFQSGSQGLSFRIAKGVNYRVGASKGQLLKNPEQLTVIDEGSVTFTNKRIFFVGSNVNREWDFSKLLDVSVGANGVYVNLAVSNRQKNSGLQTIDESDITVGLLAAVAIEAFEKDIKAAKEVAVGYSSEMKALLDDSLKTKTIDLDGK